MSRKKSMRKTQFLEFKRNSFAKELLRDFGLDPMKESESEDSSSKGTFDNLSSRRETHGSSNSKKHLKHSHNHHHRHHHHN